METLFQKRLKYLRSSSVGLCVCIGWRMVGNNAVERQNKRENEAFIAYASKKKE